MAVAGAAAQRAPGGADEAGDGAAGAAHQLGHAGGDVRQRGAAGSIVLGLWRLYRRLGGEDLLLFAPVAWLVCSLAHYENMLYGMMNCWYFTLAGVVWAVVLLAGGGALAVAAAALCAFVASFSILNGLLVWPLGLGLLLLHAAGGGRGGRLLGSVGASSSTSKAGSCPAGSRPPLSGPPRSSHRPLRRQAAGAPLAGGSAAWSAVIGALLAAGAAWSPSAGCARRSTCAATPRWPRCSPSAPSPAA